MRVMVNKITGGDEDAQLVGVLDLMDDAGVPEDRWPPSMDALIHRVGEAPKGADEYGDVMVRLEDWPELELAFEVEELGPVVEYPPEVDALIQMLVGGVKEDEDAIGFYCRLLSCWDSARIVRVDTEFRDFMKKGC